ncbi:hypothetical protein HDU76_005267 [Blyttiomyces sp. JEL0837]|nr:hypothetical protein HDU76_005267 [Blyttiomyces sp. JEL0837]
MKRCFVEDVDPCLFYAYTAHLNAGSLFVTGKGAGNGLSNIRKRLIDGMMKCCVSVEGVVVAAAVAADGDVQQGQGQQSQQQPQPHPTSAKTKCTSCTLLRDCDFRLKLADKGGSAGTAGNTTASLPPSGASQPATTTTSPNTTVTAVNTSTTNTNTTPTTTESFPLCRFCRDRVTAANDFLMFMAHLRQPGKQGVTILGMFRHVMWLRRRMAVGRVGNSGLFEAEALMTIDKKGEGEWERMVQFVN